MSASGSLASFIFKYFRSWNALVEIYRTSVIRIHQAEVPALFPDRSQAPQVK